ncbi:MAG TPA: DoxX family protein [Thermoanaerobaculia bacterium]|jgi:putative oxidoreductase
MKKWSPDVALLLLRVAAGLIFLPHGWGKVFGNGGPAAFASSVAENYAIPAFLGYLAAYAEVFGALFLIAGLFTRIDAFLLACTTFVATFIIQLRDALYGVEAGASKFFAAMQAIELPLALFAMTFALVLTGGGRLSLDALLAKAWEKRSTQKKAAAEAAAVRV